LNTVRDPSQDLRFVVHRPRPALDRLACVPLEAAGRAASDALNMVDLGYSPGTSPRLLRER